MSDKEVAPLVVAHPGTWPTERIGTLPVDTINDLINSRERGRAEGDRVDCGAGRDTVLTDNTTEDIVANNCEVIKGG